MHPHVTDPSKTLEYGHTHLRAARNLPQALALTALGIALITPFGDWPPDGMYFPALILGGWGSGSLAYCLFRLAKPDRPTLVLSREGILHRLATDRVIPWSEVRGVRKQDVEVRAGLRLWGSHPGATAVTISKEGFNRLMQGRQLTQYLFGMGHFGAKGEVVDLYVFPKQAYAENDELLAAVETRWRAFGGPESSSRRGGRPSTGAGAMMGAADSSPGVARTPLFTPLTLFGTIVAGAIVAALAIRNLG
ncbi:MAG: hypothetical protein Q8S29_07540 [Phreatobacter sp.]|nr:hypothetical protein [Phreatobacter sp.]